MAERVVVDASVALAYLMTEVGTQPAKAVIAGWQASGTELLVPSHFWLEVTNALVRGNGFSPGDVVAEFVDLDFLDIKTIEPDRPLLLLAIDQMVRFRLSAYDAIYLALALSTDARLATLDRRLAGAAGDVGILVGSDGDGRLSGQLATYATGRETYSGWAHTAVVGAHIAELRRQALADA